MKTQAGQEVITKGYGWYRVKFLRLTAYVLFVLRV